MPNIVQTFEVFWNDGATRDRSEHENERAARNKAARLSHDASDVTVIAFDRGEATRGWTYAEGKATKIPESDVKPVYEALDALPVSEATEPQPEPEAQPSGASKGRKRASQEPEAVDFSSSSQPEGIYGTFKLQKGSKRALIVQALSDAEGPVSESALMRAGGYGNPDEERGAFNTVMRGINLILKDANQPHVVERSKIDGATHFELKRL